MDRLALFGDNSRLLKSKQHLVQYPSAPSYTINLYGAASSSSCLLHQQDTILAATARIFEPADETNEQQTDSTPIPAPNMGCLHLGATRFLKNHHYETRQLLARKAACSTTRRGAANHDLHGCHAQLSLSSSPAGRSIDLSGKAKQLGCYEWNNNRPPAILTARKELLNQDANMIMVYLDGVKSAGKECNANVNRAFFALFAASEGKLAVAWTACKKLVGPHFTPIHSFIPQSLS